MTELLRELEENFDAEAHDIQNLGKLSDKVMAAVDAFAEKQAELPDEERAKVVEALGKIIDADVATYQIPSESEIE